MKMLETYVLEIKTNKPIPEVKTHLKQHIGMQNMFILDDIETVRIDNSPKQFKEFYTRIVFKTGRLHDEDKKVALPLFVSQIKNILGCYGITDDWYFYRMDLINTHTGWSSKAKE